MSTIFKYIKGDKVIWVVVIILSIVSILAVYSSSGTLAYKKHAGNTEYYLLKHVIIITSDNGKEFSYHEEIAQTLDTEFYFANPYQSWQRGLNEHTNGLIREYFPKKKLFKEITDKQIVEVQN